MKGRELLKLSKSSVECISKRTFYNHYKIGTREIVGHGGMCEIGYQDNFHYPYPAIRFREEDAIISVS